MPTLRGWLTAGTGVALWGAGRTFGTAALEQVGFAVLALVAIAVAVVVSRPRELRVERSLTPARARAGQTVRVELDLANHGSRPLPLLLLDDRLPLELSGHARFALAGLEAGGGRRAAYELRPPRRGRYALGPLRVTYTDPFGLAGTSALLHGRTELLVHPRIDYLTLPRDVTSHRNTAFSALRQLSGSRGEDFYTLREYFQGDDLRKIHWPSTAKRAKPMIRQEETPWQTRATILLDDRYHPGAPLLADGAFEGAVGAAASFADLYHRSGYIFRLVGAVAGGVPPARGSEHFQRCLDLLAMLDPVEPPHDADPLLSRLGELEMGAGAEGTLVVVSTGLSAEAAAGITRCLRRFLCTVVLLYPTHRFRAARSGGREEREAQLLDAVARLGRSGVPTLVLGPGESLQAAWSTVASGVRRVGEAGKPWVPRHARA